MSLVLVWLAALPGCKKKDKPQTPSASEYAKPSVLTSAATTGSARPAFTDITDRAGIEFVHVNGARGDKWMPETMGGGGGFFDYDNDGFADILLINSAYWPDDPRSVEPPMSKLYRNRGDGTFEDVSEATGMSEVSCYGMGATMADYDADGNRDIYITAVGKNILLRNDAGRFVDVTDAAGVGFSEVNKDAGPWEWSTGVMWIDADRDGHLDLFVCNYVLWTPETDIWTTRDGTTKAYATPEKYAGAACVLFRNRGDGTFVDVTREVGLHNPNGKSMATVADDFNRDGWPDIVVTNDTQPNFLYINQGDGTYQDQALAAGVAYDESGLTRAGMGVGIADINNSGSRAIAIGNFSGEPLSLYTQLNDATFVDRAGTTRLSHDTVISLTFGVAFADFNLDGFDDLILANGHIEPEIERVSDQWQFAQWPQLFLNDGSGRFVDATDEGGPALAEPIVGRAVATADIDHDGDVDVLLTTMAGPPKLLRNELRQGVPVDANQTADGNAGVEPNYVRVMLTGPNGSLDAIGTRLTAQIGRQTLTRYVSTGGSYLSQSELVPIFGLGGAEKIDVLTVYWPDGTTTERMDIPACQTVSLSAGSEAG